MASVSIEIAILFSTLRSITASNGSGRETFTIWVLPLYLLTSISIYNGICTKNTHVIFIISLDLTGYSLRAKSGLIAEIGTKP